MPKLHFLFALWVLAACGQQPAATTATATQGPAGDVVLGSTQNLPDWLLVARQRDCGTGAASDNCSLGEIHFNQRTITRNADGTADIWTQVRYGRPRIYETERQIIHYDTERVHYRFNCANNKFMIIERQIMGANETIVAHEEPMQIWRSPVDGSATPIFLPIACRGS
ncbi:MAG TPA: surface-adhesin E family protein [Caulobacterales bacterium]|nr:surface-adhesin E family protein [Caulobacterales bacterium]